MSHFDKFGNNLKDSKKLKVSADGIFTSLQGEGETAGKPAVFLRLQFCNLACGLSGGWKCDTDYTWNKTKKDILGEPYDLDYKKAVLQIKKAWMKKFRKKDKRRLIITGGEPLLQQQTIVLMLKMMTDWEIEIETNGTIKPLIELSTCQINCSPKLKNSGNHKTKRYKPEVLKYINSLPNPWFKFVALTPADLKEVDYIVKKCGINKERVFIMPEGHTAESVTLHAEKISRSVKIRGWKLSFRNQLIWFGTKRRT